jgi:hypothetical protein
MTERRYAEWEKDISEEQGRKPGDLTAGTGIKLEAFAASVIGRILEDGFRENNAEVVLQISFPSQVAVKSEHFPW